jgi:glycosyltransferase involved in cell wall biosynthesis
MVVRELNLGGIERDVSKLSRNLDRSRFQPHVACFRPGGLRWEEIAAAGIPLLHLPVTSFRSASALHGARLLRTYLRERSIQVVHAFDAPTDLFAIPLARAFRVPVAVSSQLWLPDFTARPLQRMVNVTHRLAHAVYVNCRAVERRLVDEEHIPARRIRLCYNGVETQVFHPPAEPRPEPGPAAPLVVGTVAVLRPEKGLPLLLEAFAGVRKAVPHLRLRIVGDGPLRAELTAQSRRLGIAADCEFHPAAGNVADLLRTMDIFVLPSLSEAFSNALLEAMACGCCSLGSNVGGTPELIADGERGLLFEPGNREDLAAKLARLASDPPLRSRLGQAAAGFAHAKLNVAVAAGRLADIYGELLART